MLAVNVAAPGYTHLQNSCNQTTCISSYFTKSPPGCPLHILRR